MPARSFPLAFVTWMAGASVVAAGPGVLDLIPADAAAGFAIHNLNELKKKGDRLIAEVNVPTPLRPSQVFEQLFQFQGITKGVNEDAGAAWVLANPDILGVQLFDNKGDVTWEHCLNLLVAVVPFRDRDEMAGNFGIKKGDLRPDTLVKGQAKMFGKFFLAHGNHLYFGNDDKVVNAVVRASRAGTELNPAERRRLNDADILLHIGRKAVDPAWKQALQQLEKDLAAQGEGDDRKLVRQLTDTLATVGTLWMPMRVDGGLGISLIAVFPKEGNDPARKFLTSLQGGPGASDLGGLPAGQVVAALGIRGGKAPTTALLRMFTGWWHKNVLQKKFLLSAADQANFVGVFTEVWRQLTGSQVAFYHNADRLRFGLFGALAILESPDPDQLLREMRQLARFADGTDLDLAGTTRPDDVAAIEALIRDLGDNHFETRQSATTKLSLIGEPVLPALEKALASDDLEVRRRAQDIKKGIVAAATERRKELLGGEILRHVRPTFAFARQPESLDGRRVDVVGLRLSAQDAAAGAPLRELLGPDWNKIRLAVEGKHVVALWGSDPELLRTTLKNLKEGGQGLAGSKLLTEFTRYTNPARQVQFHLSLETATALLRAADLSKPLAAVRKPSVTSFALTVDAERLQVDVWMPVTELKIILQAQGW